jgi:DNA end-binding protein Ku
LTTFEIREHLGVTPDELQLAQGLIDQMSNGGFEPEKYEDEYRLRVLAMIDEKLKGREVTTALQPAHKPAPVIDLMEALKQSMRKVPKRKVAGTRKTRKKA